MYRWAPGNQARARTEPAPSELLKATGMQPYHGKGSTRRPRIYAPIPCGARGGAEKAGIFRACKMFLKCSHFVHV